MFSEIFRTTSKSSRGNQKYKILCAPFFFSMAFPLPLHKDHSHQFPLMGVA